MCRVNAETLPTEAEAAAGASERDGSRETAMRTTHGMQAGARADYI